MEIKYCNLNNKEKEQVINTYIAIREAEEEQPCSIERAKDNIECCTLLREDENYIMVLV